MKYALVLLRIALGGLFLYAGLTKVLDPHWSAAGYLQAAKTLPGLFHWFASTQNIGWVNFVNTWGLTLAGLCLILGLFTRWAALGAILLMALYYLPILHFPYVGDHYYLVDEHIVFILALAVLALGNAGQYWGLDKIKNRLLG